MQWLLKSSADSLDLWVDAANLIRALRSCAGGWRGFLAKAANAIWSFILNAIKYFFAAMAVLAMTVVGLIFAALPYAVAILIAVFLLRACS